MHDYEDSVPRLLLLDELEAALKQVALYYSSFRDRVVDCGESSLRVSEQWS